MVERVVKIDFYLVKTLILFVLASVLIMDYWIRSPDDAENYIEYCEKLISAKYSTARRGSGSFKLKMYPVEKTVVFRPTVFLIENETDEITEPLKPFVGERICVRYIQAPVPISGKIPVEILSEDRNDIIVPSEVLVAQYLGSDRHVWIGVVLLVYSAYRSIDKRK